MISESLEVEVTTGKRINEACAREIRTRYLKIPAEIDFFPPAGLNRNKKELLQKKKPPKHTARG